MNKARFEVAYYEKGTIFNGAWVERTVSGKDLVLKERLDESGQLLGLSNWVQCTIQELLPARSYIFKVRVKGGQHPWSAASAAALSPRSLAETRGGKSLSYTSYLIRTSS